MIDGEFRPGGRGREWCDAEVLRSVRQRSLAKLRQEVEPVDAGALGRFLVGWHGLARPRAGLDGLLDVIEQLQGVPLVASLLDREVLAARVRDYTPAMLDTLLAAGEVTWVGVEPLGERDGRIALYLTDHVAAAAAARRRSTPTREQGLADRDARIVAFLARQGASFFGPLHEAAGGGFPQETLDALVGPGVEGPASPTTRCMRCAPSRRRRSGRGVRAARRSDRAAWCRRRPKAGGRWRPPRPARRRPGPRPWPTSC